MSTKRGSFAKFLYRDYSAVVVKPLTEIASNLNLLDVLVKVKNERGHPVLENAGSMLKLGTPGASYEATERKLREELEKFEKGEGTELFSWTEGSDVSEKFSSASSLKGSILSGLVDAKLNLLTKDTEVVVSLQSFETAGVNKAYLEDVVMNGKWKPDIENNRLKKWPRWSLWVPGTKPRGRKMWVVHQLLYASKVVVSSVDVTSTGGKLTISAVPTLIMGPTPGAGVTVYRTSNESLEFEAQSGKRVLIGFRAISFRFDGKGNIFDFSGDAGDHRPIVRAEDDDDSLRPHLRGLFLEKPPEFTENEEEDEDEDVNADENEEWDVQPLDIHVDP